MGEKGKSGSGVRRFFARLLGKKSKPTATERRVDGEGGGAVKKAREASSSASAATQGSAGSGLAEAAMVAPRTTGSRLRRLTTAEVEARPGRWAGVSQWASSPSRVWVNAEPVGWMLMKRNGRLETVEQPTEAACFSHSPPDQALQEYNEKRWAQFTRRFDRRFAGLVDKKVGSREADFARIHEDGKRWMLPATAATDAAPRKAHRRSARNEERLSIQKDLQQRPAAQAAAQSHH